VAAGRKYHDRDRIRPLPLTIVLRLTVQERALPQNEADARGYGVTGLARMIIEDDVVKVILDDQATFDSSGLILPSAAPSRARACHRSWACCRLSRSSGPLPSQVPSRSAVSGVTGLKHASSCFMSARERPHCGAAAAGEIPYPLMMSADVGDDGAGIDCAVEPVRRQILCHEIALLATPIHLSSRLSLLRLAEIRQRFAQRSSS
jgi:hypothetical protein